MVFVGLVACARSAPVEQSAALPAPSASVAAATSSATPVAAPPSSVCKPVVLNHICIRPCAVGRRDDAGTWVVDSYNGAHASLETQCDDGGCTDVLALTVPMGGACAARPLDRTCHFEGDVCKGQP